MAEITIPRYAPIMNMVLKYDPERIPATNAFRGEYVVIPNSPDINFAANQNFTIEIWVQPAKVQKWNFNTTVSILEKWGINSQTPYPYVIRYMSEAASPTDAGKVVAARYTPPNTGPTVKSLVSINDGKFHYVVFLKNGSMLFLYIDGVLQDSEPDTTTVTDNLVPVFIGKRGHDSIPSYFTGQIGQLRMWNKPLSPERILEIWKKPYPVEGGHSDGHSLSAEGLVADWRCNEGYGNTAFDYVRGNNGLLGDRDESHMPEWTVSTILRQPNFILDAPFPIGGADAVLTSVETAAFRNVTLNQLLIEAKAIQPEPGTKPEADKRAAALPAAEEPSQTRTRPRKRKTKSAKSPIRAKSKAKRKRRQS